MQTFLRPKPESQPGLMHAQTASARFSTAPPLWAFRSVDRFLNLPLDSSKALNAGLRRQGLRRFSSCCKSRSRNRYVALFTQETTTLPGTPAGENAT